MHFRKILLSVLFVSLAAAALFGAAGVLLASETALWRISGTCILTAVAAVFLLAAAWLSEKPKNAAAALAATALIVIEYLLGLSIIWEFWQARSNESPALTIFFLLACGVPAIVLLRAIAHPMARWSARIGLALSAICFVLFMLAVWTRFSGYRIFDDLGAALAGFGLLAVLCLLGVGVDRHHWRWAGVAAAALAYAIAAYAIWYQIHEESAVFVTIVSIAAVIAQANVLRLVPLRPGQIWLLWITIAAGVATAGFIDIMQLASLHGRDTELLLRLASACAIVTGCGTLALLVLARINHRVPTTTPIVSDLTDITIICPLCRARQLLKLGHGFCQSCGLIIDARVEEPHCSACGYSLLMLKSNRCPECGAPVAHDLLRTTTTS